MIDKVIANRYRILSEIGKGGMAVVYKANDEVLNRIVAVKILNPEMAQDPVILVRFFREASAARALRHPNVVAIYDVGEDEGLHYIVMEYINGPTLKELIHEQGAMPVSRAISMMMQLCDAVEAAHAHKIIHRDIKPQNVLVENGERLKITDFGIAVHFDGDDHEGGSTAVMGSAHYLAPESAIGHQPDYRVDVYALGIVFFELLCGSVPFTGSTPAAIALKHMQDPLPGILPYNTNVPQSIENVVIKATAKDPDERYESVAALRQAIERAMDPANRNEPRLTLKTTRLELPERQEKPPLQQREPEIVIEKKAPLQSVRDLPGTSRFTKILIGVLCCLLAVLVFLALIASGWLPVDGWFGWTSVPAVAGMSEQQVMDTLSENGISASDIIVEQQLSDTVPAGSVIGTSVPEGERLRAGQKLTLQISRGPSYLIQDYTGRYLTDVQKELADAGVTMDYQITYQGSADTNPGIVLVQNGLAAGSTVDPLADNTISFVVSSWPTVTITPDLIGMDVEQAKQKLNNLGIAVLTVNSQGGNKVVQIDPPLGSTYTQEGTDSVVTLYY